MNIEKRPSGSYRVRKIYQGVTYTLNYDKNDKPTKARAEREINVLIDEARRKGELPQPKSKMTIGEACAEYNRLKKAVLSPSTIRGYDAYLRNLPEECKNVKLTDVNKVYLQRLAGWISESHSVKYSRNVYNYVLSVLRMFLDNVPQYTPQFRQTPTDMPYEPSEEDIHKLLDWCRYTDYEVPFILGIYGVSRSELCAISGDDIDGDILHIHKAKVQDEDNKWIIKNVPKNSTRDRYIAIPEYVASEIKKSGYAFKGYPNVLTDVLYRFCDQNGIPRFSFHKLRHFFASKMSTMLSEADVLRLGGWKSDYVMKQRYRYSLLKDEEKKRAAAKMLQDSMGIDL